ncbi:MAG: glycosyltransferase family 9 protein, partial [Candidatus Puniceispirillaceae bacterium]
MSSLSSLSPDPKSARKRLLVVQPLVGIGDMVWHKPWIDHLAGGFDVILAAKPTAHAKTLFHGTGGIVGWLDIDRSMRGRRGRHDGLAGLFRLAADFRRARADAVLVVHHSATYTLAARLAGIPLRWGYGIGGSRRWLNRGAFLGREARHERPYRKLGRYAQVNGFGLDQPHWHMSA